MAASLNALASCLGGPFADLTAGTRIRLAAMCDGFAELIRAGEDAPDRGISSRSSAGFLVSALFALRSAVGALPLSKEDEAWMVAEIEADLGDERALLEARTGRPRSSVPPRPLLVHRGR
jgi:hypothetical protein